MPCTIKNPANINLSSLEPHIQGMYDFFDQKIGFKKPPVMVFDSDRRNQDNVLGKTAYYDPETLEIHIYSDGRHPKDMLRSIAHELIHHQQNMENRLNVGGYSGPGYYLENDKLRKIEQEAMLRGNALMREYEDTIKKENNQMSLKEWKNNELNKLLLKKFGILKEDKEITHMCALEVTHKASGQKGHPIKHTLSESGDISHYTVEFDSVIVENIAVENLDIVVQEMHRHKKDDGKKPSDEDKPVVKEQDLEKAAKPDFLDKDKDGNTDESFKDAVKDAEENEGDSDKEDDDKEEKSDDKKDDDKDEKEGDKDLSKVPPQLRDHVKGKMKESKINLKEVVQKALKISKGK